MILLSFDTEEFDVPKENDVPFSIEQGMEVSKSGTIIILDILKKYQVKASFFCTGNFSSYAPEIIKRIKEEGHEIACHGVDHWRPQESDVRLSKEINERVSGERCFGYRQPRMYTVNDADLESCGYLYNSSLNPTIIPGHYMHFNQPRTCFMKGSVLQIPSSVTPIIRFPLFWLSLHLLPECVYYFLVKWVLKHDHYFTTYFHPWEFYDIKNHPEFKTKWIVRHNSGESLAKRLEGLIRKLKRDGFDFITYTEFANRWKENHQ